MAIKFKRLYQAFQADEHSKNLGDFALLDYQIQGSKRLLFC